MVLLEFFILFFFLCNDFSKTVGLISSKPDFSPTLDKPPWVPKADKIA